MKKQKTSSSSDISRDIDYIPTPSEYEEKAVKKLREWFQGVVEIAEQEIKKVLQDVPEPTACLQGCCVTFFSHPKSLNKSPGQRRRENYVNCFTGFPAWLALVEKFKQRGWKIGIDFERSVDQHIKSLVVSIEPETGLKN